MVKQMRVEVLSDAGQTNKFAMFLDSADTFSDFFIAGEQWPQQHQPDGA